jgi:enoyl-CoA hydratase
MLRTERRDAVLLVTIDRPERKNALTVAMRQELERLCATVDEDDAVRVMVLTGADPVFSAGADIKEIGELSATGSLPSTDPGAALRSVGKPVLCAVNGPCVTGGLELALSCDLIVASERATFVDTHARLGALPRWGLSALLPRAVGLAKAKELTLTGAFIGADEALRFGLVNHVWPHEELGARTLALARQIAATDPAAVRASLRLYDRGAGCSVEEALALEAEAAIGHRVDPQAFAARRGEVSGAGRRQEGS